MADWSEIPEAPRGREDLKEVWALLSALEAQTDSRYREAAERIGGYVETFGRIGAAELSLIHSRIDAELKKLEVGQNTLLYGGLAAAVAAARLGFNPAPADTTAESMMVRRVIQQPLGDGLNLSARLWRIHAGAARDMKILVDVAVQRGWGIEAAVQHTAEITPELLEALESAGGAAVAKRLRAGLLTDSGNARMKFKRVLRTEINRAHGERYKQLVREDPEAVGLRFMLSPRHPRRDICDEYAAADSYGLGPGVYPVDACPWPAHPNTFSYVEAAYEKAG